MLPFVRHGFMDLLVEIRLECATNGPATAWRFVRRRGDPHDLHPVAELIDVAAAPSAVAGRTKA